MLANRLFGTSNAQTGMQFIGVSYGGASSSVSLSLQYPANTQTGDLAIVIFNTAAGYSSFSATGWTSTGTSGNIQWLRRTVGTLTAQTFTRILGAQYTAAQMIVFRNATYGAFSYLATSSGAPNPPLLPSTYNGFIVICGSAKNNPTTPPTSYTIIGSNSWAGEPGITTAAYLLPSGTLTNHDPSTWSTIGAYSSNNYTIGLR